VTRLDEIKARDAVAVDAAAAVQVPGDTYHRRGVDRRWLLARVEERERYQKHLWHYVTESAERGKDVETLTLALQCAQDENATLRAKLAEVERELQACSHACTEPEAATIRRAEAAEAALALVAALADEYATLDRAAAEQHVDTFVDELRRALKGETIGGE
jgi:hypothetical protein